LLPASDEWRCNDNRNQICEHEKRKTYTRNPADPILFFAPVLHRYNIHPAIKINPFITAAEDQFVFE